MAMICPSFFNSLGICPHHKCHMFFSAPCEARTQTNLCHSVISGFICSFMSKFLDMVRLLALHTPTFQLPVRTWCKMDWGPYHRPGPGHKMGSCLWSYGCTFGCTFGFTFLYKSQIWPTAVAYDEMSLRLGRKLQYNGVSTLACCCSVGHGLNLALGRTEKTI